MSGREDDTLQRVAERVIAHHLSYGVKQSATVVSDSRGDADRGVSVRYTTPGGILRSVKVKGDPYFGVDEDRIRDRSLPFYRASTGSLAFEAVADVSSRELGWALESNADDLYYYYLALAQEEKEVVALLAEDDDLFFSELVVERDDLIVLPMAGARAWFAAHAQEYPPRPVRMGSSSGWCRLVPRETICAEIPGIRLVGPVFSRLLR